MVAMTTAGMLTALAPPVAAATGGTIKVAYENYGANITAQQPHADRRGPSSRRMYPGWTVNLEPIAAAENAYYTKLDLMSQSASTAPDVLYEDTFLVNSDVAAGYLAPLNSYLSKWSGWNQYSPAAKAAAKGVNGHIYGVSMGTDTRGLWYNKTLLAKAGIAVPVAPQDAGLTSSRRPQKIKATEPGVTPINVYSGVGTGEASHHAGLRDVPVRDQQLALTTPPPTSGRQAGAGWQAVARPYLKTLYTKGLADRPQARARTPTGGTVVGSRLLPQGKLAIDLDGSWVVQRPTGVKGGSAPWPQWSKVMGVAPMPTQNGQGAGHVSMSGGWLLSVGSHATNKQMAVQLHNHRPGQDQNSLFYDIDAGQIATRSDVASAPSYKASNASVAAFSSFVPFTHFRPAFTAYPKLSNEIQVITGQVMTGQITPAQGVANVQQVPDRAWSARATSKRRRCRLGAGGASASMQLDHVWLPLASEP